LHISSERTTCLQLDPGIIDRFTANTVSENQTKFQREEVMADVFLGIAIAGLNTLIVSGVALAVMKAAG